MAISLWGRRETRWLVKCERMARNEKKAEKSAWIWSAAVAAAVVISILAVLRVWYQLKEYEMAALELCAAEQDRCVELVLSQISRAGDCTDEEIAAFFSGEEASPNRYWVFARGQLLRFIRDEKQTSQYKDVTAAAYFSSDSAAVFLLSLQTDSVVHGEIIMDGEEYLISGAAFVCQDEMAQIFLVTNKSVLLDNGRFSSAKIQLYTLLGTTLFLMMLLFVLLFFKLRREQKKAAKQQKELKAAFQCLSNLDQEGKLIHNHLWREDTLEVFLHKLRQRKEAPLVRITAQCSSRQARARLLQKANRLLDGSVLRFEAGETGVIFLFLRKSPEQAAAALAPLAAEGVLLGQPYLEDVGEVRTK